MRKCLTAPHVFVHPLGMASLIARLQKRYIVEGDELAHDAETCIGELMAALRKIAESQGGFNSRAAEIQQIARDALAKCANGE